MRYIFSIVVLTISGCGSMSWLGLQRSSSAVCDGPSCSELPLSAADSVSLGPAPLMEYPMMEGSVAPLMVPEVDLDPPTESVPVPNPDPST